MLASQTRDSQAERGELMLQETLLVQQQDRLLNLRLDDDIDQETYARKSTELRDRLASIKLQLDVLDRWRDELGELTRKCLNFRKRRILETVCLNCTLDGVTLSPKMRKPFDVIAEGLISAISRGNWTSFELFLGPFRAWKQADWQLATECTL